MDIEKFEKTMNVFVFREHQNFLSYLATLESLEWTTEDVKKYVKEKRAQFSKQRKKVLTDIREWEKIALTCPRCSTKMRLYAVNTAKNNQTGDNSMSQWICPKCWNDIYSEKSVQDWLKELNLSINSLNG